MAEQNPYAFLDCGCCTPCVGWQDRELCDRWHEECRSYDDRNKETEDAKEV